MHDIWAIWVAAGSGLGAGSTSLPPWLDAGPFARRKRLGLGLAADGLVQSGATLLWTELPST